ncbi:hypothetical protein [Phenylobacterium sp.]|uniref:hypothetical protein n=1 Tax=Phenylobacterium sp. TaxID=1871053 RepID=UPI002B5784E3|nr:hypothetical protein [Phenylobacterium sp.]HLZ75864.1 hypothetical protein [Phenylobacterium sp.]
MDIHKPKPWHGLREFLKEYAIIVVGVLTALAAEQTVEFIHVQTQVREAREALRDEISRDATFAEEAVEENRCIDAWFGKLTAWAKGGSRPDLKGTTTMLAIYPTTVWDVVKTGAVSHMPLKDQLAYAQFYFQLQNENGIAQHQRDDGQKISSYQAQESLTPDQARGLLETIAYARPLVHATQMNGAHLVEMASGLGAGPTPMPNWMVRQLTAFCAVAGAAPRTTQR